MSDPDRFAIVPVAGSGLAPANAIVVGSLDAVMEQLPDTVARANAIAAAAQAAIEAVAAAEQKDAATASVTRMITDTVTHLSARLDAYRARQAAAEAAQEARRIQDALASLPDPDDPGEPRDLSQQPALQDDTHIPGGELHDLPPKEDPQEDIEQDARGEFLRRKNTSVTVPPQLDMALMDVLQPRAPVAAGLDRGQS